MELGYEVDFDSKEKFFKIKERQIKNYIFTANIILENGMVDLVWIVRENGNLILGHLSMIFDAKWQNFCVRKIPMPMLV